MNKINDIVEIKGKNYEVTRAVSKGECIDCSFVSETIGICKTLNCVASENNGVSIIYQEVSSEGKTKEAVE